MLRTVKSLQVVCRSRSYSQVLAGTGTASAVTGLQAAQASPTAVRYPYFVPRNTQGSIPVYTDVRNHNKILTLIRNIEGNVDALAVDLTKALRNSGSAEAAKLKAITVRGRHIILSGGNWKHQVTQWLQSKGF